MNSKQAWLAYTVIRLLAFAVPFAAIMLALPTWQFNWLVGAAAGAIISLAVSYIFLQRQRARMGEDLKHVRERRDTRTADDKSEDAALEGEGAVAARVDTDSEADDAEADTLPAAGTQSDPAPESR